MVEKPIPAILINCDCQSEQFKRQYEVIKAYEKAVEIVRKMRNSGVIALDYVQTAKNLADPFTKGLSRHVIDEASREMGLRPT